MSVKYSTGDKAFMVAVYAFLTVALLVTLYPLVYVVSASFSSPHAVVSGRVWLYPVNPTLMGYEAVFQNRQILVGFMNSFIYMILGTVVNLFMTMLAGFALSRKELYRRNVLMTIFVIPLVFSGGLIPLYLVVRSLGILDTRWAMILPQAISVWNVIITRTYYQVTLPNEMYEAANMDGCSDFKFLSHIVLPLSGPILAVMALYYGVAHWNSYFWAMIYLKTNALYPLQIVLRNILILNSLDMTLVKDASVLLRMQGLKDLLKFAIIVVASLPLLIIYPFVQKYFVRGVMIGALKG